MDNFDSELHGELHGEQPLHGELHSEGSLHPDDSTMDMFELLPPSGGPLNTDLSILSVINDLRERLALISPAQIALSERKFQPAPKQCRVIGVILRTETRALHALWLSLIGEAALEHAKAAAAIEVAIEQDHKERHAIVDNLSDVARELWWTQAKTDLGFNECESVSICTGWQLVATKNVPMEGLARLMSAGPFRIGPDED